MCADAPAAAPAAAAAAPPATPGAPASILYKTPKEGERIPRSKGIYVEYHIENFVEGMWSKFFLRSAEIARPTTDRFGFEFPEAGPGFYTVRCFRPTLEPARAHARAVSYAEKGM